MGVPRGSYETIVETIPGIEDPKPAGAVGDRAGVNLEPRGPHATCGAEHIEEPYCPRYTNSDSEKYRITKSTYPRLERALVPSLIPAHPNNAP